MGWLMSIIGSGVFKMFGDSILSPIIQAYLQSKNIDLQKYIQTETSVQQIAAAVLQANVEYEKVQLSYIQTVLQWLPFRIVLWFLLTICAARFALTLFDSTYWWMFGCELNGKHVVGDACSWSFPSIHGSYAGVEVQFLLFWIVAKPVDTAVNGLLSCLTQYLRR